jgi:hypothetical protein
VFKISVRTSQETYHVSATEPNRLMLFRERVAVYCENHTEHTNTLCGQNSVYRTLPCFTLFISEVSQIEKGEGGENEGTAALSYCRPTNLNIVAVYRISSHGFDDTCLCVRRPGGAIISERSL